MDPELKRSPPNPNQHDRGGSKDIATFDDAINYMMKVKITFLKTPDIYAKFLQIMNDFRTAKINMHEVKNKVANLFYKHDDLLLGFNKFIPDEHKITIPVHKPVPPTIQPPVQVKIRRALL